jgi:hypothetical protein
MVKYSPVDGENASHTAAKLYLTGYEAFARRAAIDQAVITQKITACQPCLCGGSNLPGLGSFS